MLLLNSLIGLLAAGSTAAESTPAPSRSSATSPKAASDFEPRVASRAWKTIVVHHSATSGGDVASIDAVHRQQKDADGNPWLGIGYHFVVGNGQPMADGEIQPTFRWARQLQGAHAGVRAHNETGIGICLIGNFDEAAPTARQVASLQSLMLSLSRRYGISREQIVRHRDLHATQCPGRLFPWERLLAVIPPATGS